MRPILLLACLMLAAAPAQAQQRTLDVPATARWQHARSGVILPTAIDGLPRGQIVEIVPGELDIGVHYEDADTRISVFLYRPALFDVGIWFDRADWALRQNRALGAITPSSATPLLFTPAGATAASAMRQSYAVNGDYRATATAIVPTGRWLVKLRVSSRGGSVEQVDARLAAALAAIRTDATRHTGVAARPIQPCAVAVRWRNARQQPRTMEDAIMGALLGSLSAGDLAEAEEGAGGATDGAPETGPAAFVPPVPDPAMCRDVSDDARYAVYRRPAEAGSYVMVVGDSGASASVGEALTLAALTGEGGRRPSGVTFFTGNQALVYPNFNRLPAPDQVYALLERGAPMSSSTNDPDLPDSPENNQTTVTVPSS